MIAFSGDWHPGLYRESVTCPNCGFVFLKDYYSTAPSTAFQEQFNWDNCPCVDDVDGAEEAKEEEPKKPAKEEFKHEHHANLVRLGRDAIYQPCRVGRLTRVQQCPELRGLQQRIRRLGRQQQHRRDARTRHASNGDGVGMAG